MLESAVRRFKYLIAECLREYAGKVTGLFMDRSDRECRSGDEDAAEQKRGKMR